MGLDTSILGAGIPYFSCVKLHFRLKKMLWGLKSSFSVLKSPFGGKNKPVWGLENAISENKDLTLRLKTSILELEKPFAG